MIRNIVEGIRRRIASDRAYRRSLAELEALTHGDLMDMRADRGDMIELLREGRRR